MGYMVFHAIVVTDWDNKRILKLHKKAADIFKTSKSFVSEITPMAVNGYRSFFIAPDGSKLGWEDSVVSYKARKTFVNLLRNFKPFSPEWALVRFGDEEGDDDLEVSSSKHSSGEMRE